MLDITTQAVDETATIHIKNANGELLYADAERTKPVQIVIYGPGSSAFGVVEARQSARAIKRMQDNDGKVTAAPYEDRVKETAEDLAAITVKFENFSYPPAEGKTGAELFAAVYADPKLGFIARQVSKFVSDWGNFKPGSAGN
ncbi:MULTISPECIES: hypothetical protein [unclassified Sphingobium]|uniref:hypothetical protein n=1 Tax=unclassified Sphingobium TaxID=2611147 RepID=UPI00222543CB|nr:MULTISPECIES: hypothetical protein [unclassified Sphingobium]MCW2395891.1 hypothetical protein [Sphingobium sp. B8D3B]MCW2419407.1 hypothetical protein [Sphingobium sp. B8D3C]